MFILVFPCILRYRERNDTFSNISLGLNKNHRGHFPLFNNPFKTNRLSSCNHLPQENTFQTSLPEHNFSITNITNSTPSAVANSQSVWTRTNKRNPFGKFNRIWHGEPHVPRDIYLCFLLLSFPTLARFLSKAITRSYRQILSLAFLNLFLGGMGVVNWIVLGTVCCIRWLF